MWAERSLRFSWKMFWEAPLHILHRKCPWFDPIQSGMLALRCHQKGRSRPIIAFEFVDQCRGEKEEGGTSDHAMLTKILLESPKSTPMSTGIITCRSSTSHPKPRQLLAYIEAILFFWAIQRYGLHLVVEFTPGNLCPLKYFESDFFRVENIMLHF